MANLLVLGGPNGSGKTTVTNQIPKVGAYINADVIKKQLHCSDLEAAEIAEATRERLLKDGMDITFESVLSVPRNIIFMGRAHEFGYHVSCVYVLTANPEVNVKRVEQRVRDGGHDVPPEKVRERYHRSMRLIPQLLSVCDEIYFVDNTPERGEGEPSVIASVRSGMVTIYPGGIWSEEMITTLLAGEYEQK